MIPIDVLIVEDDGGFSEILTRECERKELKHKVIQYAEDAVAYLADSEPATVVLDLKLPWSRKSPRESKDGGRRVFDALQTAHPFTPVIVTSAYKYTDLAVRMAKEGGADYIQKTSDQAVEKIVKRICELKAGVLMSMRQAIWKLANMLEDDKLAENDFQVFFEANWWMFGYVEYVAARPQERPDKDTRTDFLLERFDGFFDIWELKLPNSRIVRSVRKGVFALTSECAAAIGQVMEYIDTYDRDIDRNRAKFGDNIYLPQGVVVIGRDSSDERNRIRIENENSRRITILTYDDILRRARRVIEFVKRLG